MSASRPLSTRTLGLTGAVVLVLASACAGDAAGPDDRLTITADAAEVVAGGLLGVSVSLGGRRLPPTEVQWLSRDPTTVVVRGGVARGVFPGVAYAVAMHGKLVDSVRLVVRFPDLQPGQAGVRIGTEESSFRLQGVTSVAELTVNGVRAQTTSVIAGSGAFALSEPCCRVPGDTVLQLSFAALPTLGLRTLTPPVTTIETRLTELLIRQGADDAVLMINEPDGGVRFYVPVKPASLEISRAELPSDLGPGVLDGRVAFEAAGLRQNPTDVPGKFHYTPIGDRTITIYAEFSTPVRRSTFTPPR